MIKIKQICNNESQKNSKLSNLDVIEGLNNVQSHDKSVF